MKRYRFLAIAAVALSLTIGLLLPCFTAAGQDAALSLRHWPLSKENAHYAYQGTLMNRVLALNAQLNASASVVRRETERTPTPSDLIDSLAAFLPISGACEESIDEFLLSPKQYSAEYRYQAISYALDAGALSVIIDSETQLPLRIELSLPSDQLTEWLSARSLWDILHSYAALLDLGEPTDDDTNISTIIRSQSAQLRGTSYKITVTAVPSTGALLLKLSASTPA